MGRYKYNVILLAVPLEHEQATLIHGDNQYYLEYNSDGVENFVFLFTNNDNFYRDVNMEFDKDKSIEHFIGIELSNNTDVDTKTLLNSYLNGLLDTVEQRRNYELFAIPLLEKLGIPIVEPKIILVSQVN